MTDIEKLKDLEAKAVAARIEYMNDLVDGPEKYHRCVNEYKNALYIEAPALLASLASKDAEIERLNEWKSRLHSQVDDFAERYAQAAQEPKQLRAELTTALAALGEAKSGLVEIEAITPHKATRLCARATLAKLNALEGNEDG